jgi:hypothetical protein
MPRDYENRPRREYGNRPTNRKEPQGYKNRKMNDDTYQKRREIINVIYKAKKLLSAVGVDMPRIEARIVDIDPKTVIAQGLHDAVGIARFNSNQIWIPASTLDKYKNYLDEVVFHEILHAAYNVDHDEKSPLMRSRLGSIPIQGKELDDLFVAHVKQALNKK